jgi:hypothetical protein
MKNESVDDTTDVQRLTLALKKRKPVSNGLCIVQGTNFGGAKAVPVKQYSAAIDIRPVSTNPYRSYDPNIFSKTFELSQIATLLVPLVYIREQLSYGGSKAIHGNRAFEACL